MTHKKESNSPVSREAHAQLQHLLEQIHQIANELHASTKKEEAEAVLSDINELPETSQVAFLKSLTVTPGIPASVAITCPLRFAYSARISTTHVCEPPSASAAASWMNVAGPRLDCARTMNIA